MPLKTFLVDPAELSEDRSSLDEATEPFKVRPLSNSPSESQTRSESFSRTEEAPHVRWRLPSSLLG